MTTPTTRHPLRCIAWMVVAASAITVADLSARMYAWADRHVRAHK